MGKERRLEKKIKKLEEVASAGGQASVVADTVVAELDEAALHSSAAPSVNAEKEKKSRKKRAKKSAEPPANSQSSADISPPPPPPPPADRDLLAPPIATPTQDRPQAQSAPRAEVQNPQIVDNRPSSSLIRGTGSSSESTISPLMGATISNSTISCPSSSTLKSAEIVVRPSTATDAAVSALPLPADTAPMTIDRKLDILSDILYESLTDQLVSIRALRDQMASLVSEECHKICDARLRKRTRPMGPGLSTPKKRKPNGYQLFCQVKRLECTPVKQAFSELSRMWKELTEEERNHYRTEAERLGVVNDLAPTEQNLEDTHEVNDD